jgi:pimeloyl-ACP methyl ester carboxylesterase
MHGSALPDPQTPTLPPRAAEGPGGSDARPRREIQRNIAARSGFEPWTQRCARSGHIRGALVPTDPMSRKLAMPVLAFGAEKGVGMGPIRTMRLVARDVRGGVFGGCGHYQPEEAPRAAAEQIIRFLGD